MAQLFHARLRLQFNFSVTIRDDELEATYDKSKIEVESTMREKQLLLALLKAKSETFTDFLKKNILIELETIDSSELETMVFGQQMKEETILKPVIESMDAEEASFFSHALAQGTFAVQTEKFSRSIKVQLHDVTFL